MTDLSECAIIYGVLKGSPLLQTLITLFSSASISCTSAQKNSKKYQFADFVIFVREKIDLEKYIAISENKLIIIALI